MSSHHKWRREGQFNLRGKKSLALRCGKYIEDYIHNHKEKILKKILTKELRDGIL